MSQSINEKMANAILVSDAALTKAAAELQAWEARRQAAIQLIPATIQQLQKAGFIVGTESDEMQERLQNHDQAVAILKMAAEMVCERQNQPGLFVPPVEKKAEASQGDGFQIVGMRGNAAHQRANAQFDTRLRGR